MRGPRGKLHDDGNPGVAPRKRRKRKPPMTWSSRRFEMCNRYIAIMSVLALTAVSAMAQAPAKTWTPSRTADGQPDLQGTWTNATLTPLQRPPELAGKEFFTEEEQAAFEKKRLQQNDVESVDDGKRGPADLARRAYNGAWFDRGSHGVNTRRTSLVVDPPDGRIPAFTPEGKKKF